MAGNLTVTFVVPAYNEADYIERTLTSISDEIKRANCAAEIIVVNNASTDGTGVVAASVPGVTVIDEPVKGLVQARRAGFLAARGDLIANIDADTILTEGWLERVLAEFSRNPRLVALSGPYVYYDAPTRINILVRLFYGLAFTFYILNRFVLRVGSMLQGGNFVVTARALDGIGGYNLDFSFYGEDTDLARRLNAIGDVKFTFALPALSSGRRLLGEGVLRVGIRYSLNFLWATFLKRPFTAGWLDIRKNKEPFQNLLEQEE